MTVEAELDEIFMIERHYSDLYGSAKEHDQVAKYSRHSVELLFINTSRSVQHEENVLYAVRLAVAGLASIARSVIGDTEWYRIDWQRFRFRC